MYNEQVKIKIMKFNKLVIIPIVIGTAVLAGCANESAKEVNLNLNYVSASNVPVNTNNPQAQAQMAQASSSVSQSLQQLSAIQVAKNPSVKIQKPSSAGGLSRQASLNWNGPVESAVAHVASAAGYHLRVLGSKPSIPVIVNVNASNQSLGEILQNIKFQAAPTVTIKSYPSSHVIELRYNKK